MDIAVFGAGGIDSYLVRSLHELSERNQLPSSIITVYDDDSVELSNILYQDFDIDDVMENKALSLSKRYTVNAIPRRLTDPEWLNKFDFVACCVDNTATRRLVFNYCFSNPDIDFVDLRSEGKSYAVFTKEGATLGGMLKTLPMEDIEAGSCQLDVDKRAGIIQQGNKIVALIGSQVILDRARGVKTPLKLRQTL